MLIEPEYGGQGAPFRRFARFLTRMATLDPMIAGLASVHGCIGAVDPVRTFGTPEQKKRLLPRLACGEVISGFALTEPCAGSDLTALRTTAVEAGDDLEITGEKLFITNAIPGRTVGLVVLLKGKPAVVIAELPEEENEQFQIVPYGLYALRHGLQQRPALQPLPRAPREPADAQERRRPDHRLPRAEPGPACPVRRCRGQHAHPPGQHAPLGGVPPHLRPADQHARAGQAAHRPPGRPDCRLPTPWSPGAPGSSTRAIAASWSASSPRSSAARRSRKRPSSCS